MTQYYKPIEYVVTSEEEGWILKNVLQRKLGISRKLLSKIKLTERGVMLNGERVYISVPVTAGDQVAISLEKETSDDILPQNIDFDIIYEDDDILVVNKTAGMIVHPTHGHYTDTLANAVVYYWNQQGEQFRFRPVHRLDQYTSGLIAIAKNKYVHQHISEQMIAGTVLKKYQALVYGKLSQKSGSIDAPIDRDPVDPHLRIVSLTGQAAFTTYELIEQYKDTAFVELQLGTGRTHQIRVHMLSIGHPLIGDEMYFDTTKQQDRLEKVMGRQALHAYKLGFVHPTTGEEMLFEAPLPLDMLQLKNELI
ncbi:23S rRNA pseudouridine1911/1915/1917 synthase [Paenibacillus turicensis]|uniref:Pseudouridine synthase n=1 Tax=Paenibacillus turicensis TaxID=160487 RepID=A0ABS4FRQ1_9BACL|nr:RluA family pseudouridine synthase [Paenibacillus turicensis]MBP1905240.1 23S rRNA pseudouridine1911/1915/1917 synthase [Paenibacillus turicensis]